MAKSTSYVCQQCGYVSPSLLGRCPECQSWGSLVETLETKIRGEKKDKKIRHAEVVSLRDVEKKDYSRFSTGLEEFNRVLGGGIVAGSVVLIAGDPGIGKSTLLSQLAINVESTRSSAASVLYVAGEESAQQIKLRIDRIKKNADFLILSETDVDVIIQVIEDKKPSLVIVDSIQTLETQDLNSSPGSVGQVRECAHRLARIAKASHTPIFIVGHVTKEGTVAGPKTLEHLVDTVLNLEGDTTSNFRVLRGIKNRFGPTDEVGIFEMEESGMREVKNPSQIFLEQKVQAPGSVVVAMVSGVRAILVEIQALVTKTNLPIPRRIGNGVDNNRLQLLVAVLSKRLNLPLFDQDVFVNVTGGMKLTEPAADLGIAMAIISSLKDKAVAPKTVFAGEVGLLGELRVVRQMEKRKNEAKKLGFSHIISPPEVKNLKETIKQAF